MLVLGGDCDPKFFSLRCSSLFLVHRKFTIPQMNVIFCVFQVISIIELLLLKSDMMCHTH